MTKLAYAHPGGDAAYLFEHPEVLPVAVFGMLDETMAPEIGSEKDTAPA